MPYSPSISTVTYSMISVTPSSAPIDGLVISPEFTYNQILQSLGTFVYGSEFIYLYGNTYQQIGQPITYNHFDANGNSITTTLAFAVDPYQSQSSIYYETNPEEVILDGFSSLTINILPNSTVFFKTFVLVEANTLFLNENSLDAFQEYEVMTGEKFFEDYCNYLTDEQDAT